MKKFSMGKAWSTQLSLMTTHGLRVCAVHLIGFMLIGGLVFFIANALPSGIANISPEDESTLIRSVVANSGLIILLITLVIILYFGTRVASWRLILSRDQETIGSAIRYGLVASFSVLFLAFILSIAFIFILPITDAILATIIQGPHVSVLEGSTPQNVGIAAISIASIFILSMLISLLFLYARFATTVPIMAAARSYNPFTAMNNSWRITKNNSIMLMLYFFINLLLSLLFLFILLTVLNVFAEFSMIFSVGLIGFLYLLYSVFRIFILAAVHDSLVEYDANIEEVFS